MKKKIVLFWAFCVLVGCGEQVVDEESSIALELAKHDNAEISEHYQVFYYTASSEKPVCFKMNSGVDERSRALSNDEFAKLKALIPQHHDYQKQPDTPAYYISSTNDQAQSLVRGWIEPSKHRALLEHVVNICPNDG